MPRGSQQLNQGKHMFCLPKLDHPVLPAKSEHPIWKTGTSGFSRQSIFTINILHTFHHHTNIHEAQIRCIELKHMNKHKGLLERITSLNINVHTLQIVLKSIGNKFDTKG
jgi:hypothetical protein